MATVFFISGCADDVAMSESDEIKNSSFETYYNKLMECPGISIIGIPTSDFSTRTESVGFPCITDGDIEYLSSLNQTEFENLHDSLVLKAGGAEVLDSLQVENYMSLYNEITNNGTELEKMHQLKDFCINYLVGSEEFTYLTRSAEGELSSTELQIYAQQAAFIDRVSRPIYEHLSDEFIISDESLKIAYDQNRPGDHAICMEQLGFKLALAGLDIGVSAFLDAMTGGIGTEGVILECLKVGVDATAMWTEYEICN